MQLPSFLEVYQGLISTSSISSTDARWDEGNQSVIDKLASWFSSLGFVVDTIEVAPG
ncbi:MAG: acetylornithine deacetylase, partial [Vibrio sp.]|nr:acetylornithine deacetylase [Vibrio sp.]